MLKFTQDICTVKRLPLAPSCVRGRRQYMKELERRNTGRLCFRCADGVPDADWLPCEHSVRGVCGAPGSTHPSQKPVFLSSVKMVSASIQQEHPWGCPATLPHLQGQLPETPAGGEVQGLEPGTHEGKQCWEKYLSAGNRWHPQAG